MKLFAQFISFILNPIGLLLFLPFFVVYRQTGDTLYSIKWGLFTSLFLFTVVGLFFIGKWRGMISDYDVSKREERLKIYLLAFVIALSYLAATLFFKGIRFSLSIIAFGICVAIIVFLSFNYRLKASGHVAVASAFVITLGILFNQHVFYATIWIVPLIAWSRVYLGRHTIHEVVAGGALGGTITLLTFLIGKYIYLYAT